ncbi:ribonuclease-like 3 [Garra rufa]|uniref:ribonuclease-like 3 n=1 Tax=Garra rufa TaxID=137080 RepID=UPI003CCEECF6
MEIHQVTVILLLLLCVSSYTHGQSVQDYQEFLSRHGGLNVKKETCTEEMRNRNIVSTSGHCKRVNNFIQAEDTHIKSVCRGVHGYSTVQSSQPFPVVTCTLQSGKRHPNCIYSGQLSTSYIVLRCAKSSPVHYERSNA